MKRYVKDSNPDRSCNLDKQITITEDIGLGGHYLTHLPGNNPLTYGPENAKPLPGAYPFSISLSHSYPHSLTAPFSLLLYLSWSFIDVIVLDPKKSTPICSECTLGPRPLDCTSLLLSPLTP